MIRTTDAPRGTLLLALAASMLVHASAGMVLGRGFDATRELPFMAPPPLSVRIENPATNLRSIPVAAGVAEVTGRTDLAAVLAVPSSPERIARDRPAGTDAAVGAPRSVATGVTADTRAQGFTGRVRVMPDPTLLRMGSFLERRSHAEFPSEVREPVRLGEPLHFDYPAAALAAHREGVVLAWLVVGADGAVDELNIVSGDDDFSLAVADALAAARLRPAIDIDDRPIPFWAVLEFDFQIDRVTASGGAVTTSRR